MKRAFIVYYADRSGHVVIAEDMMQIPSLVEKFDKVVKIELIPFDVL